MANRRMFSKSITNSSRFLMMPQSSQNLYFHLGMNADDDGFCEHFTVMRMTESKPDDLKVLHSKGFVAVFDEKVLVILDWKENNLIRNDRYTPSKYLKEYKKEIKNLLEEGLTDVGKPVVNQRLPQDRLGKDRLGKDRLGKDRLGNKERATPRKKQTVQTLLEEDTVLELSKALEIDQEVVQREVEKMVDWLKSKGKRYKDYKAFARNWLRKLKPEDKPKSFASENRAENYGW